MTVSELIAELDKIVVEHGDHELITEGCDCYGSVDRVEVDRRDPKKPIIILRRPEGQ